MKRFLGIKAVQQASSAVTEMFHRTKVYEQFMNPVWSIDENIEVLTRTYVREEMDGILSGKISEDYLQELSDVLFNIVYPAYMKRPKALME
jgi:hypothetical protein